MRRAEPQPVRAAPQVPTARARTHGAALPQRRVAGLLMEAEGTVCSPPRIIGNGPGAAGALGLLAGVVLALLLLPYLIVLLLPLIVLIEVLWMVGSGWALLAPLVILLPLGRRRTAIRAGANDVLAFRIRTDAGSLTQAYLRGHQGDIELGDRVQVSGARIRGVLHAWRVCNRSTGVTMVDRHMLATGSACALLAIAVVASLGSRV